MNNKRVFVVGILGLFLISMMGGVLGEDLSDEAGEFVETGTSVIRGVLGALLGPLIGETELLSRIFFALLLGMIIFSIISTVFSDSSKKLKWGITIAITSLALLGLPEGFLEAVRTQYGAMGATILTVIPFIIILLFSIKTENLLITRVTWLFYAMYYLSMYSYKIYEKGGWFTSESIPYMAGFVVGLFLFFGIGAIRHVLFEGKLQGLKEKGMSKVQSRAVARQISDANLSSETGVKV